jgi:hypothetical protein
MTDVVAFFFVKLNDMVPQNLTVDEQHSIIAIGASMNASFVACFFLHQLQKKWMYGSIFYLY